MKAIRCIIAAAALAFVLPAPATAATTDPEITIYRFPGVLDDGSAPFAGIATVFHCTNFSGAWENIRFVTRGNSGELLTNNALSINHLMTTSVATHTTRAYAGSNIGTGLMLQGSMAIAATSINIICTAMTVDAANAKPDGVALRGIRFSPAPGSQE